MSLPSDYHKHFIHLESVKDPPDNRRCSGISVGTRRRCGHGGILLLRGTENWYCSLHAAYYLEKLNDREHT